MRVFALCVDDPGRLEGFQEELGEGITLLADPEGRAVEVFGMRDPSPFPPRPLARSGTFLLDAEGVVGHRWLPGSYHQRPDPTDIVERLR